MTGGENGPKHRPEHQDDELPALDQILRAAIDSGALPSDCPPQPEHVGEMPNWARAAVAARVGQTRRKRWLWPLGLASAAVAAVAVVFALRPGMLKLPDPPDANRSLVAAELLPTHDPALAFGGAASRLVPDICLGYTYEALADHETGNFGDASTKARQRAQALRLRLEKSAAAWVANHRVNPDILSALLDKGTRPTRGERAGAAMERVDPVVRARFRLGRWLYLGASGATLSAGEMRTGAEMLRRAVPRTDALEKTLAALSDGALDANQRSRRMVETAQHLCARDSR